MCDKKHGSLLLSNQKMWQLSWLLTIWHWNEEEKVIKPYSRESYNFLHFRNISPSINTMLSAVLNVVVFLLLYASIIACGKVSNNRLQVIDAF